MSFLYGLLLIVFYIHFAVSAPIELYGLNYNTRKGPDFSWDKCKLKEEITRDLTLLHRITSRIRLLSLGDCGQGEQVLEVAKSLGLKVWLGMWVSQDEWVFEAEKGKLADLLNRGLIDQSTVLGITVGSETVYREEVTVDQIVDYHNQVKGILANEGITNLPVAITEPAPVYSKEAQLRTEVDLIYTNIFPFWENIPIDAALADLQEDINWILNLPESQGKDFILGETGWPSDGLIEGIQPGTPENQAQYFVDFYCKIDKELNWKYYWFTAIDNSWRREQDPENFVEGNFGFLQDDLTLKPFFKDLTFTCSNGIEYSFSETDWTIPIVTAAPAPVPLNSCQAHTACASLFGNCCPSDEGSYLGCCDGGVINPPALSPTKSPITPTPKPTSYPAMLPTLYPSKMPMMNNPTITNTSPPSVETPMTMAPTRMPSKTPVSQLPTRAPSQPPTRAPSQPPTTQSPTKAPAIIFPTSKTPITYVPSSLPTRAPITNLPTTGNEVVETAKGLQIRLTGMTKCDQCQDAFVNGLVIQTNEYYYAAQQFPSGIQIDIRENGVFIRSVVEPNIRRALAEASQGVLITYDHTFSYIADSNSPAIDVARLAMIPLQEEEDRDKFVERLKISGDIFDDLVNVKVVMRENTSAPTNFPTKAMPVTTIVTIGTSTSSPTIDSRSTSSATGSIEDEGLSIGAIIGIGVGGGILLLVCIGCFFVSKRLKKDDGRSQGGYEPPDDFSFGVSSSAWSSAK